MTKIDFGQTLTFFIYDYNFKIFSQIDGTAKGSLPKERILIFYGQADCKG